MRIRRKSKKVLNIDSEYFVSLMSGLEGGLATTAGIVAGMLTGTLNRGFILTAALLTMLVQAFNSSMARVSAQRIEDALDHSDKRDGYRKPMVDGFAQFITHAIGGVIILLPLVYSPRLETALLQVVTITLMLLFAIGMTRGYWLKRKEPLTEALELIIMGGLVINVGLVAGLALSGTTG